jgi:uncharacterized delta-60 repeat protein
MFGRCHYQGIYPKCVARIDATGALDTAYGTNGVVVLDEGDATAASLLPDGSLLVSGTCITASVTTACTRRILSTGAIDSGFLLSITISKIRSLPDGKLQYVRSCGTSICVGRLSADGSIDGGFPVRSFSYAVPVETTSDVIRLTDGSFAVAGACRVTLPPGSIYVSTTRMCVAKFTSSWARDTAFGDLATPGLRVLTFSTIQDYFDIANVLVEAQDGKVIVLGSCESYGLTCIAKLDALGLPEPHFIGNGTGAGLLVLKFPFSANYSALSTYSWAWVDAAGRINLVGGCAYGFSAMCVARLMPNGAFDTSFDAEPGNGNGVVYHTPPPSSGLSAWATAGAVDLQGRIYMVGACSANFGGDPFCFGRVAGGNADPTTCTLNVDLNNQVNASDGLLVVRYLIGYRGDSLTSATVSSSPILTNAEIESYLGSLLRSGKLDADGDGQALAMTDGLLILRAMLGLTGAALTQGATNAAHPNVRNAQQILTWIENTHGVACLP